MLSMREFWVSILFTARNWHPQSGTNTWNPILGTTDEWTDHFFCSLVCGCRYRRKLNPSPGKIAPSESHQRAVTRMVGLSGFVLADDRDESLWMCAAQQRHFVNKWFCAVAYIQRWARRGRQLGFLSAFVYACWRLFWREMPTSGKCALLCAKMHPRETLGNELKKAFWVGEWWEIILLTVSDLNCKIEVKIHFAREICSKVNFNPKSWFVGRR